jgi:exodeoxyribonuclease VII small subunit
MVVKSYEEAFARLQEIVKKLEDGDLPLQQSLELFEEGIKLFRQCRGSFRKRRPDISPGQVLGRMGSGALRPVGHKPRVFDNKRGPLSSNPLKAGGKGRPYT